MNERHGTEYQICNTLATGGTAVLYKAIQTSLDRPVVIKKLHPYLISDPNFTRRFEIEAKAAASLDHENIVRIIDFGAAEDNYFIVMEYIDGVSLKDVLSSRRVLTEELTLLIAHEICMGLDHAHRRGIVHRDVKPANIMITNEGQVKITDFGLAKLSQSQTQQTLASTLLGTPLYMSPEQAIGDMIDGRSDLFSLGTICYEAITGAQPFLGENYAVVIQNIINGVVPSPSKIRGNILPGAETIVMKALSREPGKRFRNALEMAQAIESLLGQDTILSAREQLRQLVCGEEDVAATPEQPSRTARRRMPHLPLVVAGAAAAGIFLAFALDPNLVDNLVTAMKAFRNAHPVPPGETNLMGNHGEAPPGVSMIPLGDESQDETATPDGRMNAAAAPSDTTDAAVPDSLTAAPREPETTGEPVEQAEPSADAPAPAGSGSAAQPEHPAETPDHSGSPNPVDTVSSARSPRAARVEKAATGYLEIFVDPASEIYIDGRCRVIGNQLATLELPAGDHEIVCRADGHRDYVESVYIQKGELSLRNIYLEEIMGALLITTEAGAQIFIDGEYQGTVPLAAPVPVAAGSHQVKIKKTRCMTWENTVYVPPDETLRFTVKLLPALPAQ